MSEENKIDIMLKNISRWYQLNYNSKPLGVMRADEPKQLKIGYSMFAGDNGSDNYTNPTLRVGYVESDFGDSIAGSLVGDNLSLENKCNFLWGFVQTLSDPDHQNHQEFFTQEEIDEIRKEGDSGVRGVEWW